MPREDQTTPFFDQIKTGYQSDDPEAADKVFQLIESEAEILLELSQQADQVGNATRAALEFVLKGGKFWTSVLEVVRKKLMDGSDNIDALRELVSLQKYVQTSLPDLVRGKLEQGQDGEPTDTERNNYVMEVKKMALETVKAKLKDASSFPSRFDFIQSWKTEVGDLKKRLGVSGRSSLSLAMDELLIEDSEIGYDALREVNRLFSEAKIESFIAKYKPKAEESNAEPNSIKGEIYAKFLHAQLEDFDLNLTNTRRSNITHLEEQFIANLLAGLFPGTDKLLDNLDSLSTDTVGDRASAEAVKMVTEGADLSLYLAVIGKLSQEQRQRVFVAVCEVWERLTESGEPKNQLAKLILIAHETEVDDQANQTVVDKLKQSFDGGDLAKLRRESKEALVQQQLKELEAILFEFDVKNPTYRVNTEEITKGILATDSFYRRNAAANLARQEIFLTVLMDLLKAKIPSDPAEARKFIEESKIVARNSQKLSYWRNGRDGFVLTQDMDPKSNEALENQKRQMFVASFIRHLLNQPNFQLEAIQDLKQYFTDAEKFGITQKTLIEIYNHVSVAIVAFNKKINESIPESGSQIRPPLEFTDYLLKVKQEMPGLEVYQVNLMQGSGLTSFGHDGGGITPGLVGTYTHKRDDVQDGTLRQYLIKTTETKAKSVIAKSRVVPLFEVGQAVEQKERQLVKHEALLKKDFFAEVYEYQRYSQADRFDKQVINDSYASGQRTEAAGLVSPHEQAISQAIDRLRNIGKKETELETALDTWEYTCDRDYESLGNIEKIAIGLGKGSSLFAETKRDFEKRAQDLGLGKFDLLTKGVRNNLRAALRNKVRTEQIRQGELLAAEIDQITQAAVTTEAAAQAYVAAIQQDLGPNQIRTRDYQSSYGKDKIIGLETIDTVHADPSLEVIYRTFLKARQGYGEKIYSRVKNLVDRNQSGEEAAYITQSLGKLRLKLGYTTEKEPYSYGGSNSDLPAVDLSVITQLLKPQIESSFTAATEAVRFDDVNIGAFDNIPGTTEQAKKVAAERLKQLETRKAALLRKTAPIAA